MSGDVANGFRQPAITIAANGIILAIATAICFRLGLDAATTALVYLVIVAVPSQLGSLFSSVISSILALGCLSYFFVEPLFTFRAGSPRDIKTLAAFLVASLVVALLLGLRRSPAGEPQAKHSLFDRAVGFVFGKGPAREWVFNSGGNKLPFDHAESEQRYRQLIHYMPIALLQIDGRRRMALFDDLRAQGVTNLFAYMDEHADFANRAADAGIVLGANAQAIKMFGARDSSELRTTAFFWRESPNTLRRGLESAYRGETTFQEEMKLTTLDGRVLDVFIFIARPDGDFRMNLISFIDISEGVRAREKIERLQAEFARAARIAALGELTASIAHEINQPLAAIMTNSETGQRLLNKSEPGLTKVRELVQRILEDARRAADIIAQIRTMVSGKTPEYTEHSLDSLIRQSVIFLHQETQSKGINIFFDLMPALPPVIGDRVQLQQIVVNLMANAVQAMVEFGTTDRNILIRTRVADPHTASCHIEDSGPGIAPDKLPHLFDSFYTTKDTGMGIGLSICRSIIEAHGGQIQADNKSTYGGARFTFTIPIASAKAG